MLKELEKGLKDPKISSVVMRYISTIFVSFWLFGMTAGQPVLHIWATQPMPQKYLHDGRRRLQYRLQKVPITDSGARMTFQDIDSEAVKLESDPGIIVAEDGRWEDASRKTIPDWFWIFSGLISLILGCGYWSFRLIRYLARLYTYTSWEGR